MNKLLFCIAMMLLFANPVLAESEADKVKVDVVSAEKDEQTEENTFHHFKNGMNSCLLSLVYSTIKVNIAIVGGVVGSVAYPLSGFNSGVSKKIWSSSMGGTYLITEDILTGKEKPELFFKRKRDETTENNVPN
ncbi:MAG: hypothetical protein H8D23_03535 [Candidatus Brocadiales bacterium]|nr:hypothetical protein [Candidatus Brocadiales bacterium]